MFLHTHVRFFSFPLPFPSLFLPQLHLLPFHFISLSHLNPLPSSLISVYSFSPSFPRLISITQHILFFPRQFFCFSLCPQVFQPVCLSSSIARALRGLILERVPLSLSRDEYRSCMYLRTLMCTRARLYKHIHA